MTAPLIILAGADKGGVGKTQVCRAVCAYMDAPAFKDKAPPRVLDSQSPKGDLVKFCHGAEIINIKSVRDQMRIFDALSGVTVLDVSAGELGFLMQALDEARLLDDVRAGALKIALLHVLGRRCRPCRRSRTPRRRWARPRTTSSSRTGSRRKLSSGRTTTTRTPHPCGRWRASPSRSRTSTRRRTGQSRNPRRRSRRSSPAAPAARSAASSPGGSSAPWRSSTALGSAG